MEMVRKGCGIMTRQVRLTAEQFDEWQAKIQAQKRVRGGVVTSSNIGKIISHFHDEKRKMDQAGSNPAPSPKREYDSKWEETYASELVLRKHAGLIKNYWYHPFSMWLPGKVRYSPDFMIEYPYGLERRIEIVEVKGWSKNLRDGMTRLKIAAAIFPCFTWKLVKKQKGGGWDETEI